MSKSLLLFLLCGACATACPAAEPLNVLLIAVDDLNADLGCYGHPLVSSPNIDRLATRGVRFEQAYCQYPVCNPSRSSFMTGLYPEQTRVLSNGGDFRKHHPQLMTLPQCLMQAGYFAARVGKIYHYGVPDQIGTPGEDDAASWMKTVNPRGLDREVHDRIHTLQPGKFGGTLSWLNLDSRDDEQTDGIGASAAIRILEEHHPDKTGRPFFLAMGFYRPHTPYVAPSKYFELTPREHIHPVLEIPGDRDDIPVAALPDRPHQRDLSIQRRKEIIQAYYAAVSYMDAQVGRLMAALERLRLTERTLIVFVSDHGYHLGQHGLWQKSDLFEGSCRVPLLIVQPNSAHAGTVHSAPVELVDLYPTIVDLCQVDIPQHVMGRSLKEVLAAPEQSTDEAAYSVTVSRGGQHDPALKRKQVLGRSIRTERYRYTEWGDDAEFGIELYDYWNDPQEFTNLAGQDSVSAIEMELQQLLHRRRQQAQAPVVSN